MKINLLVQDLLKLMFIICIYFGLMQNRSFSQTKIYDVDATAPGREIVFDKLKLGGKNNKGESITVNSFYLSMNDKPVVPVTAEFHYSRYPNKYWEESIRKIKAGGISIIATYVFWNMHEEAESKFDWAGDKNLRLFIELCAKNEIQVIVRIGPFCHGEIRNGGLPDWLLGRPFEIRSNDSGYLTYVERFYNEIGNQLKGFYFKDGGPIIGIQLENEYQHSAAPWGLTYPGQPYDWTVEPRDRNVTNEGVAVSDIENPFADLGAEHLRVLKTLAQKAGIIVPIYTVTGWGNAAIIKNESVPVQASYPYPTWTKNSSPSNFYIYRDLQANPDYAPVSYDAENYPYLSAEIGGGMICNYNRRPTIPAKSLDALVNCYLGSGANAVGYYMFHGGATPRGKEYFYQDEAYGYPKINYDYQAPLGQYGQVHPSFNRLKLFHYFLKEFGDKLAPMPLVLPKGSNKIKPENITDLRYSVRTKDGSGFIFMNNFQDHLQTEDINDVQFNIKTSNGNILLPESSSITLKSEENTIFPFNFDLNGINLIYATAQLMTKFGDRENQYYVFFSTAGIRPEFSITKSNDSKIFSNTAKIESNDIRWLIKCSKNSEFKIVKKNGELIHILVIDKKMALKSWLVNLKEKQHLVFSEDLVIQNGKDIEFFSKGKNSFNFSVYPKINSLPQITNGRIIEKSDDNTLMTIFDVTLRECNSSIIVKRIRENKLLVTLPDSLPKSLNDIFLRINYTGDTGMALMNGYLVDDHFYYGEPWEIGLKKFLDMPNHKEINFYFRPIYKDASFIVDLDKEEIPNFGTGKSYLKIDEIEVLNEYKCKVEF